LQLNIIIVFDELEAAGATDEAIDNDALLTSYESKMNNLLRLADQLDKS